MRRDNELLARYADLLGESSDPDLIRLVRDLDTVSSVVRHPYPSSTGSENQPEAIRLAARTSGAMLPGERQASRGWGRLRAASALTAFAAMVALIALFLVTTLPRMRPHDQGRLAPEKPAVGTSGHVNGNGTLAGRASGTPTPYVYVADPKTPLGATQRFVASYLAYMKERDTNPAKARQEEAVARAFLSPRLNSSTSDLSKLGVYNDPGPGDEDGWPEPLAEWGSSRGDALIVAFDRNMGERAAGNGGAARKIRQGMEFDFVKVAGKWKIDRVKRVNHEPQPGGIGAPKVRPIPTPTATVHR